MGERPISGTFNETNGWHRGMADAPHDGTPILVRFEHENFKYCDTDEERAEWEEVCEARWIDFNGGGWTWHGLCGTPTHWKPKP